jgi:glycosyltransferase involved in cell wall biosynthesis
MQRICSTLADAGYQVELIGRVRKNSKPLNQRSFEQKRLRCFFDKGKFFYLEYNIRLLFYLLSQKTDIICGIDLDTIIPTWFAARLKSKVFVYDAHEYFTETSSLHGRKFEKAVWKKVEASLVPRVKHAYTVNQSIADIFKKEYGTSFDVVRNVPVLRQIEAKDDSREKYILYQGVLNKGRGLEFLLNCMQHIDIKLKIAGDGPLREILEQMAVDLKVTDKVEFLGFVLPEELIAITDNAWVGLNLIENTGLSYYYSLANKFFDYIQSEIPQICMDFPEYRLLNDQHHCGLLLKDFEEKVFIGMITQLKEETTYQEFIKNTRVAKKELNWQKEQKRLLGFYQNIKLP